MYESAFRHEVQQETINVPRAALCFARDIAYPDLDVAYYMSHFAELAAISGQVVLPDSPLDIQAKALASLLFDMGGFQGNKAHYNDPRNSYLNEVLERHLGLPITLAVIFVEVASRLSIPAYYVGLPGHFIVGVQCGRTPLYLDPFHEGRVLEQKDCAALVRQTSGYSGLFRAEWLAPTAPRDVLLRMLNNLRLVYIQQEEWQTATAVLHHMRLIQPDNQEFVRDLGLVYYRLGNMPKAAHYLEQYMAQAPHAPDAEAIRQGLWDRFDDWVRAN